MNGDHTTNTTTRRLDRRRVPGARLAAPALALLLAVTGGAVPAYAAAASVPPGAAAPATAKTQADGVSVATTWAQLMRRKLMLQAQSERLTVALPGLRAAATTRDSDLARARRVQRAATTALATATTADTQARAELATARIAAAAAKKALAATQKQRPRSTSRVAAAKRALTAANAVVQTRAAAVTRTALAVPAARTTLTTATNKVAAATTALRSATKVVTDTQQTITSFPGLDADLSTQAAALSTQVVAQFRGNFTMAQTTVVYGVTVNRTVAFAFQRMVDDAAADGVQLSGGGFRTRQRQIELRTVNGCPDVFSAPASSCRVPTAIPGRSLHELGLAIDLTSGKKTITDRRSKAYKWLAANAGTYGFVNLPSEAWHWSITGG